MSHQIKPMTEDSLTPTARQALDAIHAAGTSGIRVERLRFTRSASAHHQTLTNLEHGGLIATNGDGVYRLTVDGVMAHYRMHR